MQINNIKNKGFTLVELVISIGIFALMTTLLLAKFGTFNQGVLLSNLAYDVALTIRNAQSYGLNVKSTDRLSNNFDNPYGVHFSTLNANSKAKFIFFADIDPPTNPDGIYTTLDNPVLSTTNIKRGSIVSAICITDTNPCANFVTTLDITFKRPNPNAIIIGDGATRSAYARITLTATDGSVKNVEVRSTGQIQVIN